MTEDARDRASVGNEVTALKNRRTLRAKREVGRTTVTWKTVGDAGVCAPCAALENVTIAIGTTFVDEAITPHPPHPACTSANGCRCSI